MQKHLDTEMAKRDRLGCALIDELAVDLASQEQFVFVGLEPRYP